MEAHRSTRYALHTVAWQRSAIPIVRRVSMEDNGSAELQKRAYTLYSVPGGTVSPNTINLQDFDKP
jgi:hypothetical protein